MRRSRPGLAIVLVLAAITACGGSKAETPETTPTTSGGGPASTSPAPPASVYAGTLGPGLSPAVAGVPTRVYVPNSESNTVSVIDPATFEVIDTFPTGRLPQHITPSWDLKTLYVDNTVGNTLTPINPQSGEPGPQIEVEDPYNLYFTLDGSKAVVVAERLKRLDFRNPTTWELVKSVLTPCSGVDHADFSADGKTMLFSCEFSGDLIRVDVDAMEVTGALAVGGEPIDVRLSPDGSVFYVANQATNGVHIIDAAEMREVGFLPTGAGAHGLLLSRDTTQLYVTNRKGGSISVIDLASRQVTAKWEIGGSPDMGGVSTDGTQLWVAGRYNSSVYVIDTRTGELIKSIPVGAGPHGLAFFPQPGTLSLGHTGAYR
jgi:YVTN family beta-propeller protein